MRDALRALVRRSGLSRLSRILLTRRGAFVLELHGVASRPYPQLPPGLRPRMTANGLRRILRWLAPRFPFLSLEALLTTEERGVLLTFDDGFANNVRQALPVLEEFEAPALFFVTTRHVVDPRDWLPSVRTALKTAGVDVGGQGPVELPARIPPEMAADLFDGMSTEELRTAAAHPLVTIGAHGLTHPRLTELSGEELTKEVEGSRRLLEGLTGRTVDLFAYPYGDYDRRVLEAVENAGYRAAFAENSRRLGRRPFEIPRVGLYSSNAAYLSLKLSGLYRRPLRQRTEWGKGND